MTDEAGARQWVRHSVNGNIGWLVTKAGQVKVRLDGPDPYALRKYDPMVWVPLVDVPKIPRMQVAYLQWVADRELLRMLGHHKLAKKQWLALADWMRIEYMDEGPKGGPELERRQKLWKAIRELTDDLVVPGPTKRPPNGR